MFVKAIKIAKAAMFPIFRFQQTSASQMRIGVVGVGFFINSNGYFVSVAHIFDNANAQTSFRYIGQLPDKVHKRRLIISEVNRDDDYDIFIGKIEIKTPKYFYLAKKKPDVGRSVCISGYPLAQIRRNAKGGLSLGGVRRYFQPSFVLDKTIMNSVGGTGKTRKHDGFLVRDFGLFGMSGGPVFDKNGTVVGMQASVTSPRKSTNASGTRSISVENAVAICSGRILNLLRRSQIRHNFLGRF